MKLKNPLKLKSWFQVDGAGDRNRTHATSLEGSSILVYPCRLIGVPSIKQAGIVFIIMGSYDWILAYFLYECVYIG